VFLKHVFQVLFKNKFRYFFEVSFWFFLGTKDKMVGMRANEGKVKGSKKEPLRNFISIWR
jgi:hypothetical protein